MTPKRGRNEELEIIKDPSIEIYPIAMGSNLH